MKSHFLGVISAPLFCEQHFDFYFPLELLPLGENLEFLKGQPLRDQEKYITIHTNSLNLKAEQSPDFNEFLVKKQSSNCSKK